jgi:hypothetical protein
VGQDNEPSMPHSSFNGSTPSNEASVKYRRLEQTTELRQLMRKSSGGGERSCSASVAMRREERRGDCVRHTTLFADLVGLMSLLSFPRRTAIYQPLTLRWRQLTDVERDADVKLIRVVVWLCFFLSFHHTVWRSTYWCLCCSIARYNLFTVRSSGFGWHTL